MLLLENNKLKKYILENLVQEEIVAVFFGISEEDVHYCLKHKSNKIKNPLRTDKRPSLGMMWVIDSATNLPKIRIHDFSDPLFRGDCFDLVSWLTPLNPNNKRDFVIIAKTIIEYSRRNVTRQRTDTEQHIVISKKTIAINIQTRDYTEKDSILWNKWGINTNLLVQEPCYAVEYAWINSNEVNYYYTPKDPCYAYYIGIDVLTNTPLYQLYFPLRKKKSNFKTKFITNSSYSLLDIQPFSKKTILVLVKSKKDKLTILSLLIKYQKEIALLLQGSTIELRAISSENPTITNKQNSILQQYYDNIFIYTDFDRAGRQTAYYYKKVFGYYPLYMTNGKFHTFDYKYKDISDYRAKNGERKTFDILLYTLKYIMSIVDNNTSFIINNLT